MQYPEDELIEIIKNAGVDFICTLPCEKIKSLIYKVQSRFIHVPLTREEEGVGISAGAALAGKKPAMIVQSSGMGNMINALLSLTSFFNLPLAIFVSQRGIYKEKIAAQVPMGTALKGLLKALGIGYTVLKKREDLYKVQRHLKNVYTKGKMHVFLMNPRIWKLCTEDNPYLLQERRLPIKRANIISLSNRRPTPIFTRYEILGLIADYLRNSVVVSTLGFPSKELYNVLPQPSNFYMLGSMGMATPIGLGIAASSAKKVFVIDGDGCLLMNPGTLATVALKAPENLTIVAIDNGVYGSTGNQPTPTQHVTDLSILAHGFGIKNIFTVSEGDEIIAALRSHKKGPKFIHIIARPGNMSLPPIPLTADEIKEQFSESFVSNSTIPGIK
ncbi:MAG TPA: sulfopyruvate decarboxylase subunit alpha [Nitrospirae bacterium]|nr:hypothetical protein BMS3Abin08_00188 [bacterium BMS3Abin08]HDO36619.1 sulfopyruvate decarboxylase subunit alpha [Nitrospirota bacterium]HDY72058.1 sulfopyruvate decarboxylase subunit alpha [Nitrospirota bacterium]